MKSSLVFWLSLSLLAGCGGTMQTYPGEPKDASQIAIVKGRSNEFAGNRYSIFFQSYSKLEPGQKTAFEPLGNFFSGYPQELHMQPGKYVVLTQCVTRNQYAFPSFTIEAVAGGTYEVICEPVAEEFNRAKATVEKIEAQFQK